MDVIAGAFSQIIGLTWLVYYVRLSRLKDRGGMNEEDDQGTSNSPSMEQSDSGNAVMVVDDERRLSVEEFDAGEMSSVPSSNIRVSDEENKGEVVREGGKEGPSTSYSTPRPDEEVFDCVPEIDGYQETRNYTQQELINQHYQLLSEQRSFYSSMLHQQMEMERMMKQITDTQSKMVDLIRCVHEDLHKCRGDACRSAREEAQTVRSPKREPTT
ncbi:hypothetical protein OESDEN_15740 [Oesophagostomum dentatum]|uniref:Uncharacterized protein n=1 Tax=Oesophagostomum dentatum TaxID=61180 RepID=A0A0B1SI01_OESDE|nr:hypothetical protein OESDEN_15740 [Oesophagostomum dentatum]